MPQDIYYVLNSRWPTIKAHGLQVAKTCQGLVQAGAHVYLIVPRRAEYHQIQGVDPFELYGVKDRFTIVRLPSLDFTRNKLLFGLQQIMFAGLAWLFLLFKKGIVYTRDPLTAYVMRWGRRKVFWEAHRFPGNARSWLYRNLIKRLAGIVVITEGLRQLFLKEGMSSERLAVIADAVDPGEFAISHTTEQARQQLLLPVDRPIIGYVGQLSTLGEGKGVDELLQAYALLRQPHPEALLLIVGGNDPDIAHYRRQAEDMGLKATDVIFAGQQPHARVPLYLRTMDVLTMPFPNTPHYAHYMSPLKLFEYLAAGKPIVATDLPSVREIVTDADVFFARPGDTESITQAIHQALSDGQSRMARTLALAKRYSWQARAQKIQNFIAK